MDYPMPNVEETGEETRGRLAPQIEEWRTRLANANVETSRYIRENPGTSLLGALVAGFLLGRIVSRI